MKRMTSVVLALILLLSFTVVAFAEVTQSYNAGVYSGTSYGMWGPMVVQVTVDNTKIVGIEVTECNDTEYLAGFAIAEMPEKIMKNQSLAVDTTAGATMSSRAILNAVRAALKEAGGNMDILSAALPKIEKVLPDEEFDIVVVGGGGTGLSAAVWAGKNSDCSVLVLEQCAMTGGTTALSDGGISAGGSSINGKNGLPDYNGQELADFIVEATNQLDYLPEDVKVNPVLLKRIGDKSGEVFDYLVEEGYTYQAAATKMFGDGNERGVAACLAIPNASAMWGTWFTELAKKNGAEIRTNSKVVELMTENGSVVGVKVQTPEGNYCVKAKKVILATGGFANNMELLRKYNSDLPGIGSAWPYTSGGATGSVFELTAPLNVPTCGYGMLADLSTVPPYGSCTTLANPISDGLYCTVDMEGNRYTDSSKVRYGRTYDLLRLNEGKAYTISSAGYGVVSLNWSGLTANITDYAEMMKEAGAGYEADTLEELAVKIGASPENLVNSVAAHNAEAKAGKKAFYGMPIDYVSEEGPYYAFDLRASVLATLYGIKVNDDFQVVNESGAPIENLYAAGECAMGNFIVGEYPCGTMSLTCGIYGGTLAVEEAIASMQ